MNIFCFCLCLTYGFDFNFKIMLALSGVFHLIWYFDFSSLCICSHWFLYGISNWDKFIVDNQLIFLQSQFNHWLAFPYIKNPTFSIICLDSYLKSAMWFIEYVNNTYHSLIVLSLIDHSQCAKSVQAFSRPQQCWWNRSHSRWLWWIVFY